ncbi:hypothetical protein BKA63DRAFT_562236 [Paraphoma chrysanthemicola]|nr:hypothetical protein BKA63DRAFT_562236 [Paraphoma chrysanthemicola]
MFVTGIILAPLAIATPAVQDLINLRTVIDAAANTIGDTRNPNRGWGFGSREGVMGTADLVNNVTNTVLGMKWQIDTNKTAWLLPDDATNPTTKLTTPTPFTPTLPLSTSIVMPSALPTAAANATVDLSKPYIDYVSAIPNLSTALTSLGRVYHREMNSPVKEAIAGLQQSIPTLQSAMLQDNLISSQAVIRTIRASSSLEAAQVAWGRFLNLPGTVGSAGSDTGTSAGSAGLSRKSLKDTGGVAKANRPPSAKGRYYTHEDLWGRDEPRPRQSKEGKASWYDAVVQWEERRARLVNAVIGAENARVGRPFVV